MGNEILFLIAGLVIGVIAAGFAMRFRYEGKISGSEAGKKALDEQLKRIDTQLEGERIKSENLNAELAASHSELGNMRQRLEEQKAELEKIQEKFTKEFENLANKILEEKSRKFTDQNKTQLTEILHPLKEKIREFEKKVEDTYIKGTKERSELKEQVKMMMQLNEKMSTEASNLTKALKGDSKTQGNWGEVVLERILESSGLGKGREYHIQESVTLEDGKRLQPDVVIYLPDDKRIVIDAKVSLTDYERLVGEEDAEKQARFLKQHILSLKNHIRDLGNKDYTRLYDLPGLDFVLMFIPLEPAYFAAVQAEPGLFNEALNKNIVIVSGSTLLATLRTISSIWKHEYQNKNVREIARIGGSLYDKFDGFVNDLVEVGKKMDAGKREYEKAMNKLVEGKGNLVSQVERMKILGAKTKKSLPQNIIERSQDDKTPMELEFEQNPPGE